jgi:hypothetical protein
MKGQLLGFEGFGGAYSQSNAAGLLYLAAGVSNPAVDSR